MTDSDAAHLPDRPTGPDLAPIRAEIDELAALSTEEFVNPKPKAIAENEPVPYPRTRSGPWTGASRPERPQACSRACASMPAIVAAAICSSASSA